MELRLEKGLKHQQIAVSALDKVFDGIVCRAPEAVYANPVLTLDQGRTQLRLRDNITDAQEGAHLRGDLRRGEEPEGYLPLDVKMETGTGKTYVYTHAIYELHKRCGFNKFIIAVPSLAIKAGTGSFLEDGTTLKHFKDALGYEAEIETCVLETQKQKKKGRAYFPAAVEDFVKGSYLISNRIYVLLVNMQLLQYGKMLTKNDYDMLVEGFSCPADAIAATRPVVLIDEPHRFDRSNVAYKFIEERLKPQCVIRFGATFPDVTVGTGKRKTTRKDYRNLLYDLNACEAFNQGLVKGVTNEYFVSQSKKEEKVKILRVEKGNAVTFQLITAGAPSESVTLHPGESLGLVHEAFQGISVTAIGRTSVVFSNDTEKSQGEEMDVAAFMTSYQEQMVKLAIQRHLEVERKNFERPFVIKTLALFFIDDIYSYRDGPDGKDPYLRNLFEKHLKKGIKDMLAKLHENEGRYKAYLEYSLQHIDACHAGYFAQDNTSADDQIAGEVETILHGKKQLLEVRGADGTPNVCRFLFSKWTLKEGWDNPNVFTITKLRSSGSENSKIQEVGRGLRLPVDETGSRISNEEFSLNYIVDFTERDFAEKLVREVNGEIPNALVLTDAKVSEVARKLGKDPDDLFGDLFLKKFIDRNWNVRPENREAFIAEYPDFACGLKEGKIRVRKNGESDKRVKIRTEPFDKLKSLWARLNQRYAIIYRKEIDAMLPDATLEILEKDVFSDVVLESQKVSVKSDGQTLAVVSAGGVQYTVESPLPYGVFLKRISKVTNLPVPLLDGAVREFVKRHGPVSDGKFNEKSASEFCRRFREWRSEKLQTLFKYKKANTEVKKTALTGADGKPLKDIAQGLIGLAMDENTPCDKYLYDAYTYDSPLERKNLLAGPDIDEVVVYGKIPRRSIAIPTITGGTYSPDFMFVVRKSDGTTELNLVVETKDVELETQLHEEETIKIRCAEIFFENLREAGYTVRFHAQLKNKTLMQIIQEVLKEECLAPTELIPERVL